MTNVTRIWLVWGKSKYGEKAFGRDTLPTKIRLQKSWYIYLASTYIAACALFWLFHLKDEGEVVVSLPWSLTGLSYGLLVLVKQKGK